MNEILGRMARAICAEHQAVNPLRRARYGVPSYYEDMARVAIEAMREPTSIMVTLGAGVIMDKRDGPLSAIEISSDVWRAMVAALRVD